MPTIFFYAPKLERKKSKEMISGVLYQKETKGQHYGKIKGLHFFPWKKSMI